MNKPHAPACDRNKDAILAILKQLLQDKPCVLEIGSGTGQHAVYFAKHLPKITWQTSDFPEHITGIQAWIDDSELTNVPPPLIIDVNQNTIPNQLFDVIFTANTFHIMSWETVVLLIKQAGRSLPTDGLLIVYGPFNFEGKYTAPSNQTFDVFLKSNHPQQGIRDFEAVCKTAQQVYLEHQKTYPMPANNFILAFKKCRDR